MKTLLLIGFGVFAIMGQESDVLEEFASQNAQFSAEVYKETLKSNSSNFLVCPLSVRIILALAHAGAEGDTAKQLAAGLHLPDDKAKIKEVALKLTPYLEVHSNYTLISANKIYFADRFNLSESFNSTAVDVFGSDIQNIDFTNNTEAASEMNKWIEEKTRNKIKDLVKPENLDANTVAVLINAVYFKGNWQNQFDSEFTSKRSFFVGNNKEVDVDMMNTEYYFNYHYSSTLEAQFLELPYEGDDITMTIVLPDRRDGLSVLELNIADIFSQRHYNLMEINVSIPKFKIETRTDFKKILMELGVKDAFNEESADFRGMSADEQKVFITDVTQKAFIQVTEKGTTAGAATAVLIGDRIFTSPFVADHPFLFFLKHRIAGILFVGRFTHPEIEAT